jgi:hypothetical protein
MLATDGGSETFVRDRIPSRRRGRRARHRRDPFGWVESPAGRHPSGREGRPLTKPAPCSGHECIAETRARVEMRRRYAPVRSARSRPQYGQVAGDVSGRACEECSEAGRVGELVERAQDLGACDPDQARECATQAPRPIGVVAARPPRAAAPSPRAARGRELAASARRHARSRNEFDAVDRGLRAAVRPAHGCARSPASAPSTGAASRVSTRTPVSQRCSDTASPAVGLWLHRMAASRGGAIAMDRSCSRQCGRPPTGGFASSISCLRRGAAGRAPLLRAGGVGVRGRRW